MKPRKLYRITISDESRLETLASRTLSPLKLWLWGGLLLVVALLAGTAIVALTPLRTLFPSYLQDSQRAATENAIMRVDSLNDAYSRNELYLANLRNVLDEGRIPSDSVSAARLTRPLSIDSLLPRSPEEARFASMMQDREKFNISVRASLAAEDMLLFPVSDEGVVSHDSRDAPAVKILLPRKASVMAMADGCILAAYFDRRIRSYVLIMQHDNGFVSRISGLSSLLVGEGDILSGGEILSLSSRMREGCPAEVTVELWHNGVPVKPYEYIAGRRYRRAESPLKRIAPRSTRQSSSTLQNGQSPDSVTESDPGVPDL